MKLLVCLFACFFVARAEARWAKLDEVPLVIQKLARETRVAADGTNVDRWSWVIHVERQDAREDVGTRTIRFYKDFEQVKVLRAGTRNGKSWNPISLSDLEDRSVTDESPGFSSLHEYVLSFPDVQEGSDLEFDYEVKTTKALEPKFWGQSFSLESGAYKHFTWTIRSEKPVFEDVQDPFSVLRVTRSEGGKHIEFASRKAFSLALADESDPHLSDVHHLIMLAGFLKDWKEYGVHSAKLFEEKAAGRLSLDDEKFAEKLKDEKNVARRIQKILQRVSAKLRYFGDWRTSESMYVPRSFAEIYRTSYGDCKDFALMATKLLRVAGLEAKPVWILNEEDVPGDFLYRLPTDNAFNHVIVRVTSGDQAWFVDPTNPAARVNYLADEIAGRKGLVLDPAGSVLLPIRPVEAADYRSSAHAEILEVGDDITKIRLTSKYEGYSPVSSGEQLKSDGQKSYLDEHVQRLMPSASLSDVKMEKLDLDRESGDLHGYTAIGDFENFWVKTSDGLGYGPVREDVIERLRNLRLKDRSGDFSLGKVYAYHETLDLKGFRMKGGASLDCAVESPWLDYRQKVTQEKTGVVFDSDFRLKKSELTLEGAAREQALKLQKELRRCAGRQLILLQKL